MPDSATAGYLPPTTSSVEGDTLDDILQSVVVGITGVAGQFVRPRWQPQPPPQPAITQDWVALGVTRVEADIYAHTGTTSTQQTVERDERIFVLHSFYGPGGAALCARFRAGLEVAQNRDVLRANNIALVEVQDANVVPALLQQQWVSKVDVTVVYRRRTSSTFGVLTITSAQAGLNNELYNTPIVVSP